jgi:hypothetical protein
MRNVRLPQRSAQVFPVQEIVRLLGSCESDPARQTGPRDRADLLDTGAPLDANSGPS